MPNFKSKISSHNKKTLTSIRSDGTTPAEVKQCNCKRKGECPLDGNCVISSVVYQATVRAPDKPDMKYVGLTERSFKTRLYEHNHSIKHRAKPGGNDGTTLSKYVWDCKDNGVTPAISWKVLRRASPYQCGTRSCDLCTSEKLQILMQKGPSLNARTELVAKCRHQAKYKLCAVKS